MNAAATATPPPRGSGTRLTRRWSGRSTASTRSAIRRTSGVRTSERRAAATKAAIRKGTAAQASAVNLTRRERRPGRAGRGPGRGSRPSDLRDAGREALPGRGLATLLDRVDDQIADQAHLVAGPSPARSRPASRPGCPDDVFAGWVSNGIWFLLTVIPTSSSSASASRAGHAERHHVDEHEVVVGPARDDARAAAGERLGEDRGVLDGPPLVAPELVAQRDPERDGLAGDHVHERARPGPRGRRSCRRSRRASP